LLAGVPRDGTVVVGVDDVPSAAMADRAERAGQRVMRVSVRSPVTNGFEARGSLLFKHESGAERLVADLTGTDALRGAHNAQHAAAAFAAASALGVPDSVIAVAFRSFPGLDHRMQVVGRIGPVKFVNDSKATNADAAEHALRSFQDIHWIVGGRPKSGGIEPLRPLFGRVRHAYLIGEAADAFAETLGSAVPVTIARTLENAVLQAADNAARSGDPEPVVLLSPACASFDQFRNFEIRGNAFKDLVRALPGVRPV
jgi:UDP-N-acetylmuramoylalanine--D-glutamate ligase